MGEFNNDKDLTFRNSIIGPDVKSSGIGLFNWFMKQEGPIGGFTGAIWTGVTTYTLAQAMEAALKESSKVLAVKGRVLPASKEHVRLDGSFIEELETQFGLGIGRFGNYQKSGGVFVYSMN